MNKALNKYGKVSFKSIVPKRLKIKRAIRLALSASIASCAAAQMNAIRCANAADKLGKAIALAGVAADSVKAASRALFRSDHPIHKDLK